MVCNTGQVPFFVLIHFEQNYGPFLENMISQVDGYVSH